MLENTDQKNSEYGHFSRSEIHKKTRTMESFFGNSPYVSHNSHFIEFLLNAGCTFDSINVLSLQ